MKPDIVYEDADIIICNKPAGIPSQSDRSFDADLLGAVKNTAASGEIREIRLL